MDAASRPGSGCFITRTNVAVLTATVIYAMVFDLIVLLLTAHKILAFRSNMHMESGIFRTVFYDGLIYFICSYVYFCLEKGLS